MTAILMPCVNASMRRRANHASCCSIRTAGSSFMEDVPHHMPTGVYLQGNRERPLEMSEGRYPERIPITFLRHPWRHVLSQFMECKYANWGKLVTRGTGLPGRHSPDAAAAAEGFEEWLKHFLLASESDEFSDPVRHAFRCYNPWNMQSRYLTVPYTEDKHGDQVAVHHLLSAGHRKPSLERALQRIEAMPFLGIADLYVPSLCLMHFTTTGALPDECHCSSSSSSSKSNKQLHSVQTADVVHGVPPHSIKDLPSHVLRQIYSLVEVDSLLFLRGLDVFEARAAAAAQETGVQVLCGDEVAEVRRDIELLMRDHADEKGSTDLNNALYYV